jgi:hypothetical protein
MTNLTLNNQLSQLPVVQQGFVQLRVGNQAIKDLTPNVVKRACADILSKAIFDSLQGQGKTEQESKQILAFQTEALFAELRPPFNNLTIPELQESFRRGVRGDSGQWFGMCAKTYHQFIKWFYNLPERQKSWVDYLELIEEPKVVSTIDKVMFSNQSCINAYQRYKEASVMPFGAFAYYDIINDLVGTSYLGNREKTLVHDPVIRKEVVTRITAKHSAALLKEKRRQERRGNFGTAVAIMGSITAEFKDSDSLKNLIKAEFLKVYFDDLIKHNKDLVLTN